jgi:glyoxylate reductase
MARRARGFSMRVLYHTRHRAPQTLEKELNARFVDRETLLREADFLSLHAPLTAHTHHMIGASELARMKPGAFLINTARGKVVDEEALVQALRQEKSPGQALTCMNMSLTFTRGWPRCPTWSYCRTSAAPQQSLAGKWRC